VQGTDPPQMKLLRLRWRGYSGATVCGEVGFWLGVR
jgi:hypothetical protein